MAATALVMSCGGGDDEADTSSVPTVSEAPGEVTTTPAPDTTVEAPPASTTEPPAASTTEAPAEPSGEILLEAIGVAVPDSFSPAMLTTTEQVPQFDAPDFLGLPTGGVTLDDAAGADDPAVATTAPDDAATAAVGLTQVAGNLPGLYGGTRDVVLCDQAQMIDFLEANPDKAAAWAGVHGIDVSDIRAYIESLTPVVLLRDTRVTNHGFADGVARPHQSVLQAGHAVLVDEFGVPRAKCSCGNPLAPPQPVAVTPEFVGTTWPGWDPSGIVVVIANDAVGNGFVIVDLGTGELITRPIGYAPGAADAEISALLDTGNRLGVQPGGAIAPSFTVAEPTLIVTIVNYHYGPETPPGQLGLTRDDGTFYGPWQTTGREGQGGVANAYWTAVPWEIVPAGTYTVWDSEPSTWSTNADAGMLGFSVVRGVVGVALPPAPGTTPPVGDPIAAAAAYYMEIVAPSNCAYQQFDAALATAPGMEDGRTDESEFAAYQAHMLPYYELARDALDYFAEALNAYAWPGASQGMVDQIVPLVLREAGEYDVMTRVTYDDWNLYRPVQVYPGLYTDLRAELGLPPPDLDDRDWCAGVAG